MKKTVNPLQSFENETTNFNALINKPQVILVSNKENDLNNKISYTKVTKDLQLLMKELKDKKQ